MKQQVMGNALTRLRTLAQSHREQLRMAMTECAAMFAMNGYTGQERVAFDVPANEMMNESIGTAIFDEGGCVH